ncbi:type II secretion system protein [Chryseomicrobium palamuruense]|uniref:Type II secretion system protein n=1 Tax=Chryseomicrobium palamuruense TaxID=682973 RepID=A0ABV8V034_9BACL
MKKLLKKRLNQKGLTLIELLAVIVILAIVAAIAVPAIGNLISESRDKAILAEASNILSGAKIAKTSGDCDPSLTSTGVAPAANTVGPCEKTNPAMAKYVEGIDSTATYYVKETSPGIWEITFSRLSQLENTVAGVTNSGTNNAITDTVITETELNTALD